MYQDSSATGSILKTVLKNLNKVQVFKVQVQGNKDNKVLRAKWYIKFADSFIKFVDVVGATH